MEQIIPNERPLNIQEKKYVKAVAMATIDELLYKGTHRGGSRLRTIAQSHFAYDANFKPGRRQTRGLEELITEVGKPSSRAARVVRRCAIMQLAKLIQAQLARRTSRRQSKRAVQRRRELHSRQHLGMTLTVERPHRPRWKQHDFVVNRQVNKTSRIRMPGRELMKRSGSSRGESARSCSAGADYSSRTCLACGPFAACRRS